MRIGIPNVGSACSAGGTAHEICNSIRAPSLLIRITVNSENRLLFLFHDQCLLRRQFAGPINEPK